MNVSRTRSILAAFAVFSIVGADASAASVGVNFRRASDGATVMPITDNAGFVPQMFWNNSIPNTPDPQMGTNANIMIDDGMGGADVGTIYDDSGAGTGIGVNWFANTSWSAPNSGTGDARLMSGYLDNTNAATPTQVQFTGIPYAHYDVIAYVGSDGNNRLGHVGIVGHGQGSYYRTISNPFTGYVTNPAPLTNFNAPAANANYVRFSGLSASSFQLVNARISANVGVHGVQIIEMAGPAPPPPPPPAPLELLGYWSFDASDASDSSGNGNHAALSGNASFGPGQFGNSLVLDGTRDFATVASPTAVLKPTDTLAVSVWVKNQEGVSEGEIISLGDHYGIRLRNDGRLHFFYDIRPDNGDAWLGLETTALASERVINDGIWHHIVAQKTPSALEIYVDGVKALSPTANPVTLMPIDYVRLQQGLFFGAHGNGSTAIDFQGMLDEIRVFRGTLTPDQVGNLFRSNVVPEPATWALGALAGMACLAVGWLRRRY